MPYCPICRQNCVVPSGPPTARLGVISEFPGREELAQLKPFVGPAGRVLKSEFERAGLSYVHARITNIWSHAPTDSSNDYDWNLKSALHAVASCKIILLLGSTASESILGGEKVSNISGLWLKSNLIAGRKIIAAPNPAAVLKGTAGELRHTLELLHKEMK